MCSNGQRYSYSKIIEEGLHIACIYADSSEFTLFLCLEQYEYPIDLVAIVYVNSILKKYMGWRNQDNRFGTRMHFFKDGTKFSIYKFEWAFWSSLVHTFINVFACRYRCMGPLYILYQFWLLEAFILNTIDIGTCHLPIFELFWNGTACKQ